MLVRGDETLGTDAMLLSVAACAQPPHSSNGLARGEVSRTTSMLLGRGGSIGAERYWPGTDSATLHDRSCSVRCSSAPPASP